MAVGVKVKVVEKDHGLKKLFERTLPELARANPYVRVGIFSDEKGGGDDHDGTALTNVELAAIHEFGVEELNIPERSFIRSTVREKTGDYVSILRKLLKLVVEDRMDAKQMFDIIGARIVSDINAKVRQDGVPPPLKPETIRRKGSSRALIDTGLMLASLAWVVVFGERKVTSG